VDAALCHFMGFAVEKVPLLAHHREFAGSDWGQFDLAELAAELDGQKIRVADSPINFRFVPAPGWRDHIER
jgi:hypothetical protein